MCRHKWQLAATSACLINLLTEKVVFFSAPNISDTNVLQVRKIQRSHSIKSGPTDNSIFSGKLLIITMLVSLGIGRVNALYTFPKVSRALSAFNVLSTVVLNGNQML